MTRRILGVFAAFSLVASACSQGSGGGGTTPQGGPVGGYQPSYETSGGGYGGGGGGQSYEPTSIPAKPSLAPRAHRSIGLRSSGRVQVPPPAPGGGSDAPSPSVSDSTPRSPSHGRGAPASPPPVYRQESESRDRIVTEQPADRPGLGTVFGERMISRVSFTRFQRASAQPSGVVAIHYNDYMGLLAMARHLQRSCCGAIPAFQVGGGVTAQLVDTYGRPLTGLQLGGRTLVMGAHGHRYGLLIRNNTPRRWEIVASVDGLDVIDGQRAGYNKRGYVLAPWQSLHVQGFRTSSQTVAAFRFGSVRNSYAARTGSDRNVGVVGVAAFAEYVPPADDDEAIRRLQAQPFSPYAQPPVY